MAYLSPLDEDMFFEWVSNIKCLKIIDPITIKVAPEILNDTDLRDVIALLHRYGLPMKQMKKYLNSSNEAWFNQPDSYWHNEIFQNTK